MKFTVKRSQWLRGSASDSVLLDRRNHMCCLGFLAKACGASKGDIQQVATPEATVGGEWSWPEGVVVRRRQDDVMWDDVVDSDITKELMRINDQADSDTHREEALKRTFAKLGIEVTFE